MNLYRAKERSCLLAAQRGMCLCLQGTTMWGVFADGERVLLCSGRVEEDIWLRTYATLLRDRERHSRFGYTLYAPHGWYEADNFWSLVWKVLTRTRIPVAKPEKNHA